MKISRKPAVILTCLVALVAAALSVTLWPKKPLGDPRRVAFSSVELSPTQQVAFLEGDFSIVRSVRSLPKPIVELFTEEGGSRLTMVDPGKEFLDTDVIYDSSLPNRRLIFAGSSDHKCFVLYEQGGIGLSSILVMFDLQSLGVPKVVWRGFCGPAKDLQELREQVRSEKCFLPVPREIR